MITISTVIDKFESKYLERYKASILPSHKNALRAMKICRKNHGPLMLAQCTNKECMKHRYIPHSCGHRSCPHCQNHEGWQWIENQLDKQLPTQYYLLTFTIPSELRDVAWKNQRTVYSLLFQSVQNILKQFTKNDKKLQGTPGFIAVLHTHSRRLAFHPHIHVVIADGCISKDKRLWRKKSGKFLFSYRALAKVFRARFLSSLVDNNLCVPNNCPDKWVVDCKSVGNGSKALIYLGKYLYKGVIQEKDIIKSERGMITFRYFDSKDKKYKTRKVKGEYFLWLVMQHVLPKGFRKTRSYGFLHPCSKKLIKLLQYLLKFIPLKMLNKPKQRAEIICKCCGSIMKIFQTMIPSHLSPKTVPT